MEVLELLQDYLIDQEEGMKNLLTWFLNLVMQFEALEQVGADPYERTSTRKAHRNGYKSRSLKTRVGEINLKKPQFREFGFETQIFGKYSRVEKALINAIAESYLQGVSTRRIQNIVSHLGLEQLSPSSVSRISKELDEKVDEFLKRPIEHEIRYLFIDATYFKVRDGARYISKALFIAIGVRQDGYREILGAKIAEVEDEAFWSDFFDELKERGLRGVKHVVSDGHKGIRNAVETSFVGASWQMCHVHFNRAVLKKVAKRDRKEVASKIKEALEDENKMYELATELEERGYSNAANTIERFSHSLWNYKAFPESHWKRIRTTNSLERINKELKRRSRVIGAFPNDASLLRLAVSILMDVNEEWITGRRYLSMEEE
jgi:putative transposase